MKPHVRSHYTLLASHRFGVDYIKEREDLGRKRFQGRRRKETRKVVQFIQWSIDNSPGTQLEIKYSQLSAQLASPASIGLG
jgi:hypothetical protein